MPGNYLDALARLSDTPRNIRRDGANVRRTVAESYGPVVLTLPSPRRLARALVMPTIREVREVYNRSGTLVGRRNTADPLEPVNLGEPAIGALVQRLAELPDRNDARSLYRNLRRLATLDPSAAAELIRKAVSVAHLEADAEPVPAAPAPARRPAATPLERDRAYRERKGHHERTSSAHYVRQFLTGWDGADDVPPVGSRVPAPELHASAKEAIALAVAEQRSASDLGEDWEEIAAEDGLPLSPRVPGVRVFYEVADAVLGERRRTSAGYVFQIPPLAPAIARADRILQGGPEMDIATAVLDRVVARLADEVLEAHGGDFRAAISTLMERGERAAALTLQASSAGAPVIDLASRRKAS